MERENFVQIAKLAEQTERYDDMVEAMKNVANMKVSLTVEERNLLSVAYKNVIGSRRASWRVMCSLLERAEKNDEPSKKEVMEKFQAKIEKELSEISKEVLLILENLLTAIGEQTTEVLEAKVFYLKMKGDYQRYMAEIYKDEEKKGVVGQSLDAYQEASDLAKEHFKSTHPIRLGLALNFSVFYFEILNNSTDACKLAKQAFDDAIAELDALSEENYKDSTLIMQLLRDNIALWTANENDNVEQEDQ